MSEPSIPPVTLYLDLMERCLTGTVNCDPPLDPWHHTKRPEGISPGKYSAADRTLGLDWPATAPTMIGRRRLNQLRLAVETVLAERIPGDLIETGVWRGGACLLMRAVLFAHGDTTRKVYVADTFDGLPPPTHTGDRDHDTILLKVPLIEVVQNFVRYGLLDDNVVFVPGLFKDTLHTLPATAYSVLRLDGDMYESTKDGLALYPKLSVAGYCIIDDYFALKGCRAAVDEYRDAHGIVAPLVDIDGMGVYWRKE